MKNNYFLLSGKNNNKPIASAFAPDDAKSFHDLIQELDGLNELPFDLMLFKLSVNKNGLDRDSDLSTLDEVWLDLQPNNFARPLFSERFKSIIQKSLSDYDEIKWVLVKVNGNNEQRNYFMLKFMKPIDVLDKDRTLFMKGTDKIIKPCFSFSKINHYTVFTKPLSGNLWKIPAALFITENLKKTIENEKLTGVSFEKVMVV